MADQTVLFPGEAINVVDPATGQAATVRPDQLQAALASGYKLEGLDATNERMLQRDYGDAPIQAGIEGAARGLTFGLSDAVLPALGVTSEEGLRERQGRNATAALIGEGASLLAPVGAAGLIGKAGEAAAGRVGGTALVEGLLGGGAASKAAGAAIKMGTRAAAEGALYGAQRTVSEVALSEDPMSAEAIASHLGSNMLFGAASAGAGGAALGGLGSLAKSAAIRARSVVSRAVDAAAREAAVPGDIAQLSATEARAALKAEQETLRAGKDAEFKALRAERDAEIDALKGAQKAERADVAKEALDFRQELGSVGKSLPSLVKKYELSGGGVVREFIATERKMANVIDAIETSPTRGIEALKGVERTAAGARKAFDDMIEAQRAAIKVNEHGGILVDPKTRAYATPLRGETVEQTLARARANVQMPEEMVPYLAKLDDVSQRAAGLRSRLEAAMQAPASGKLADIETKLAGFDRSAIASERATALEAHLDNIKNPSIGTQMGEALKDKALGILGGAAGSLLGGGMLGTMAGAAIGTGMGALKKAMGKSAAEFGAKLTEGLDKVVTGATAAAPKLARSVAIGTSFGVNGARRSDDDLEQRAHDVLDAVANIDATRTAVHENLAGVRSVDSKLADQIEEHSMRRLDYLASVAPKNPGMGAMGQERYKPSDAEMAKFSRCVAATEQPMRIVDELVADRLTPQTVEAVKQVYPEMFKKLQAELLDKMVEPGRAPLSLARHVGLSMITGTPTDSRLKPEFIARQQQSWAQMRKDAQERAGQKNPTPSPPSREAKALSDLAPTQAQSAGL